MVDKSYGHTMKIMDQKDKVMSKQETKLQQMEARSNNINSDLFDKASQQDFNQFKSIVYEDFTKHIDFKELKQLVNRKASKDEVTMLESQVTTNMKALSEQKKRFIDFQESTNIRLSHHDDLMAECQKKCQDLSQQFNYFQSQINNRIADMENNLKRVEVDSSTRFDKIEKELEIKCPWDTVKDLKKELKTYIKFQHLEDLRQQVLPVIKEFREVVKGFNNDNDNFRQVIQGFDVALCTKANVTKVQQVQVYIDENFMKKGMFTEIIKEVQASATKREGEARKLRDDLAIIRDSLDDKVQNIVAECIETKMKLYEAVCKSFSKRAMQRQAVCRRNF